WGRRLEARRASEGETAALAGASSLGRRFQARSASEGPHYTTSWSSGVLATLTWWRPLVQIQPGSLEGRPNGPVVQRDDAGAAGRRSGFNSRRVHSRPGGETEIILVF